MLLCPSFSPYFMFEDLWRIMGWVVCLIDRDWGLDGARWTMEGFGVHVQCLPVFDWDFRVRTYSHTIICEQRRRRSALHIRAVWSAPLLIAV